MAGKRIINALLLAALLSAAAATASAEDAALSITQPEEMMAETEAGAAIGQEENGITAPDGAEGVRPTEEADMETEKPTEEADVEEARLTEEADAQAAETEKAEPWYKLTAGDVIAQVLTAVIIFVIPGLLIYRKNVGHF